MDKQARNRPRYYSKEQIKNDNQHIMGQYKHQTGNQQVKNKQSYHKQLYVMSSLITEYTSTGYSWQSFFCGQLNRKQSQLFPFPRSRLRIWSRKTGLAAPFHGSPFILHTQPEFGAYSLIIHLRDGVHLYHQATLSRTDGVHY